MNPCSPPCTHSGVNGAESVVCDGRDPERRNSTVVTHSRLSRLGYSLQGNTQVEGLTSVRVRGSTPGGNPRTLSRGHSSRI